MTTLQIALWFGLGFISSLIIYVLFILTELERNWCPSPGGIILIVLGTLAGYTTFIILLIILGSVALTHLFENDRFHQWLSTPICQRKKK